MPDLITRRWTRSEADEVAVSHGCRFNPNAGEHVVSFFGKLRHTKGQWAGEPFDLLEWQYDDLIMPLFGWMDADGNRRYKIAHVEVPKKNGKSCLCGGIALYLLAGDGEPGAEVYCAAADRNQAGIVYREASEMAKASPLLKDYVIPRDSVKNLALPSTNSFLRAISHESYTNEGLNIHGLIFDELHAQKTRELWDALRYGGVARRQPLLVSITTAGFDKHSICYEQHTRARQILDGIVHDDTFFALIRAADEEKDDWTQPETWRKANPSLGTIISEKDLAQDCKEAQESPAKENAFKRYRLNIWTEQDVRWIPMPKWDACGTKWSPDDLRGRECWAGLDLATTSDLTAFVLVFPEGDGFKLVPYFWLPEAQMHKRDQSNREIYRQWIDAGLIRMTEGDVTDYNVVRSDINEIGQTYGIREIPIDRTFQGAQLSTDLKSDGFEVIAFGQGFLSMAAPTAEFERLVLAGLMDHGGHPILRWMVSNVSVEIDAAGNQKTSKKKSAGKIDGIVAAIMGLGRIIANPPARSVYEDRGILVL